MPAARCIGLAVLLACAPLSGCSSIISAQTGKMADNLSAAILNNNDPETVAVAAPAYLIMIDGLIGGDPGNAQLLIAGADLYAAYAGVFVEDEGRKLRLTDKALNYALHALCVSDSALCKVRSLPFGELGRRLAEARVAAVPALFSAGSSWAGWIQVRSSDWSAVADLPRVKALLERTVALQDDFRGGTPYLYLGVLDTLLPPGMGGKAEQGRKYFERSVALSQGNNLQAKVTFAERYARLVFDRELHDQLLEEVLAADPQVPGYTLANVLAQRQARALLRTSDDYF